MAKTFSDYAKQVSEKLEHVFPTIAGPFENLYKAMNYSLLAGGKRIRPVLMQLAYEAVGGKAEIDAYLCGIEMIHTYSLIHDDLPAMDDDDYRRGKLTNHKVFGEATAILAGDALLNDAFCLMLEDALKSDSMEKVRAIHVLSMASGSAGMIGGQDLIHLNKTGALISAATKMGAILGGGSPKEVSLLEAYGKYIGKVFQIVDDILDQTSTIEELGKPINSDEKNHKNTYLNFYTIEKCYEIAEELTTKAIGLLDQIDGDTQLLKDLAQQLIMRRN